jgi:hypothetical protein
LRPLFSTPIREPTPAHPVAVGHGERYAEASIWKE